MARAVNVGSMTSARGLFEMAHDYWQRLSLAHQFALAGGAFTLSAMALCGLLTTTFVAESVIQQRGAATARFMDRVISPLLHGLEANGRLSISEVRALDALMNNSPLNDHYPYLEVWLDDGTIAYSNSRAIVARQFDLPQAANEAFRGDVVVTFTDLDAGEHTMRGFRSDFIEVYFPLQHANPGTVVAVAELHERTGELEAVLLSVTLKSWVTVAVTSIVIFSGLFGIVREGSRTIERQKRTLARRLEQSRELNIRYRRLKEEAQEVARSVTTLTDQHLRTIGADLHDGPAQTISFAALKAAEARVTRKAADRNTALTGVTTALTRALDEIRDISRGLVLPDIAEQNLGEIVDYAVELHRRRTEIDIAVENNAGTIHPPFPVAICVFRFVQEGLNNAYRHGLARDQRVIARTDGNMLHLAVINQYRTETDPGQPKRYGIGLSGLRARVQSIGGAISFAQRQGETRLEMDLPIPPDQSHG